MRRLHSIQPGLLFCVESRRFVFENVEEEKQAQQDRARGQCDGQQQAGLGVMTSVETNRPNPKQKSPAAKSTLDILVMAQSNVDQ